MVRDPRYSNSRSPFAAAINAPPPAPIFSQPLPSRTFPCSEDEGSTTGSETDDDDDGTWAKVVEDGANDGAAGQVDVVPGPPVPTIDLGASPRTTAAREAEERVLLAELTEKVRARLCYCTSDRWL
jgi:hypothetical protein